MSTFPTRNQVLTWRGRECPLPIPDEAHSLRLIEYLPAEDIWIFVPIPVGRTFPQGIPHGRLLGLLDEVLVPRPDPYSPRLLMIQDNAPAAEEGRRREHILKPILGDPRLYSKAKRRAVLRAIAEENGITIETVTCWIRRWWERGQDWCALAPDYGLRGGRGIRKTAGKEKRGRPRKYGDGSEMSAGINVTDDIRELLVTGGKKFYEDPKHQRTLKRAFERTLQAHFREVVYTPEGERQVLKKELPTFAQFRYWYQKDRRARGLAATRSRLGSRQFNLQARPLEGGPTLDQIGPGMRLEVDSQRTDLHLVSPFDPALVIGRAVLYLIVDFYSRLICGYAVTLENPSWTGMLMLLRSAFTPKPPQVERFGFTIADEEWPFHHLGTEIVGDRFELISQHSRFLADELHMQVSVLPAYRADFKPAVERAFAYANSNAIGVFPGQAGLRRRGEPDPRKSAILTPHDMHKVMIQHILFNNNERRLEDIATLPKDYPLERLGPPTPRELFLYGIDNIVGSLRQAEEWQIRRALDRRGMATVSRRGLRYEGLLYWPVERPLRPTIQRWFDRSRVESVPDVQVLSDVRDVGEVWLVLDSDEPVRARLHRGYERYAGMSADEAAVLLRKYREKLEETRRGKLASRIDLLDALDDIHRAASGRRSRATPTDIHSVQEARAEALALERATDDWTSTTDHAAGSTTSDPQRDGAQEEHLRKAKGTTRPDFLSLIRQETDG